MRLIKTHAALVVWRIALLYVVLMLCRVVFYAYNSTLIGELPYEELWALLCGSFKFDTISIIYANALFILFSLLPLKVRERSWWKRTLYWYYVVVNSLLLVGLNFADTIYYHHAQKRLSAEAIFCSESGNSLQTVLASMAENWFLVLVGMAFVLVLAMGYCRKIRFKSLFNGVWYYISSVLVLLAAVALCMGGVRGGFSNQTRPIAVSDAAQYTPNEARAEMVLSNPFCILRTIGECDND